MAIYYFYFNLLISTWLAIAGTEQHPCPLYKCGGSRLEQPCACDDLCLTYGDCCADDPFIQALNVSEDQQGSTQPETGDEQDPAHTDTEKTATGPSTKTETTRLGDRGSGSAVRGEERTALTMPHPRIHCVDTHVEAPYLVVDECLPDWHSAGEMNDVYVREMCETRYLGVLPEYLVPAIESATGLSYRNLFCGVCNGGGQMAMWQYEVHCEESWSPNASHSDRFHEVLKKAEGKCELTFTEPKRRECVHTVTSDCVGDGNRKYAQRCQLYLDPRVVNGNHHRYYKNLDCAMCSEKAINTNSIVCIELSGYGSRSRWLSLSILTGFESIQYSSQIKSNEIAQHIEKEINCDGPDGVFYLMRCRVLYCRQGYSMKNGICVFDGRYNYIVDLRPGSHTAWPWKSQHIKPLVNPYSGRLSRTGDCWRDSAMCLEVSVRYQSAQNLSQTTEKLLSVLFGAYKKFKLTTDVYGKGEVTSKCINETKNPEEIKSDISVISQMLDMISASYQWPAYINFSLTVEGTNIVTKSNMEVCTLQSHSCPLAAVERRHVNRTHAEIRQGFKKFSNIPSEIGMNGLCVDVVRNFLKSRRDWRNKELVAFVEDMWRINAKNDAIVGSELVRMVVFLGVVAVVLT